MNVERFSLPLSRPLSTAAGTVDERTGFLVRVTVDGAAGVGEATPLPGWTESLDACETALRGVSDPVAALDNDTLAGAPAARHGVSLAVLDARARAAGRPLYRNLGDDDVDREAVPVNATIGDADPGATADAAARAVDAGFPAVKLKVGARPLSADLDRLEAVRKRCPDVELRADANGAWTPATAERALGALAEMGVAFVEQPLTAANLEGHAALAGGPVGVGLDEGVVEHGVDAVLEADAADVVVCKPMALGGVDRARAAAVRARAAGREAVVTTTIDAAVARAGAVHLAASLPDVPTCGLATGDRLADDLRDDVATAADGAVPVPQGDGSLPLE
ncbi:o-succinylbenzoate synthase [Halobacteriales archaeon QS_4_69_225]|nr:MAG: o-succinylbenzoate synthase [Halobacteriales archaeon QS_4_69_225]